MKWKKHGAEYKACHHCNDLTKAGPCVCDVHFYRCVDSLWNYALWNYTLGISVYLWEDKPSDWGPGGRTYFSIMCSSAAFVFGATDKHVFKKGRREVRQADGWIDKWPGKTILGKC